MAFAACTNDSDASESEPTTPSPTEHSGSATLAWLEGCWHLTSSPITMECWEWSGNSLKGQGFMIRGEDTLISEELEIRDLADGLCAYIALPSQNPEPVAFTLQPQSAVNTWVFENLAHDFPQRITYVRNDTGFVAKVQGQNAQGEWSGMEMIFRRK